MYISFALAVVAAAAAMTAYLNLRAAVDLGYIATDQGNTIIRTWWYVLVASIFVALASMSIAIAQWTRTQQRTTSIGKREDQA